MDPLSTSVGTGIAALISVIVTVIYHRFFATPTGPAAPDPSALPNLGQQALALIGQVISDILRAHASGAVRQATRGLLVPALRSVLAAMEQETPTSPTSPAPKA